MLIQLDISNIALIDHVSMELGNGLNVLTGETGAGKSIIIDSINAILGDRISKDFIRTGTERATVEAVFQVDISGFKDILEEMGIEDEDDGTLIISRECTQSGRNTCRINGRMATVSMLKRLGERLIDIHGQHDNQSLLRTESHIELLDAFGGETVQELKLKYGMLLDEYKKIRTRLRSLAGDQGERERKTDLLKFQIDEIRKSKLKKNEEEDLNKQRVLLASSEKIINSLASAYELLFSGNNIKSSAADNINQAMNDIQSIARLDQKYENLGARLRDIAYQLDDITEEIRKERDNTEYSPELLESIEERLDHIYKLKRKYGNTIEDILNYCMNSEAQLEELQKSGEIADGLDARLQELDSELYAVALDLNRERMKAAKLLEERITCELDDLEMKRAKFKAEIRFDEDGRVNGERRFTQNGLDNVEFLISPNVGEPLKPLSKIASGGEMSRIMLAIKTILAGEDKIPTLIFDEIDIGISGKASQKVGEKLALIGRSHQVICVTHLAQIACMADRNFLIEKVSGEESTRTVVKLLSAEETEGEVARILGGDMSSETSRKYAGEMLESAKKLKKSFLK